MDIGAYILLKEYTFYFTICRINDHHSLKKITSNRPYVNIRNFYKLHKWKVWNSLLKRYRHQDGNTGMRTIWRGMKSPDTAKGIRAVWQEEKQVTRTCDEKNF